MGLHTCHQLSFISMTTSHIPGFVGLTYHVEVQERSSCSEVVLVKDTFKLHIQKNRTLFKSLVACVSGLPKDYGNRLTSPPHGSKAPA
jgi:hypothetical protein